MSDLDDTDAPQPRIQIVEYMGKSGGFATTETRLYKLQLVNQAGFTRNVGSTEWGLDAVSAVNLANGWKEFLSWPVIRMRERVTQTIDLIRVVD
jgi:hypothetical protein